MFDHQAIKPEILSRGNDVDIAFMLTGRCISRRFSTLFHIHQILAPGRAQRQYQAVLFRSLAEANHAVSIAWLDSKQEH